MDDNKVTYFAETDSRNKMVPFGIKAKDRTRHVYVIGKTGMGKSTLLENMAVQDIQNGEGLCFIDPHGKTAELLLDYVPEHRINDVLYFAPFDLEYPISFNVMEDVGYDKRHLVVSGLMSTFKKIWEDAWSARMEYILSNTLLALLEYPDATLLGVNRMLADKDYRKKVVENVKDPAVKSFWVDEFAKYTEKFAAEATPAIQNKIGQFTSNPLIRNLIGQPRSTFDIRKMMDERKIIIINLSKGRVGESNANLLGSMFITKIYLGAMSRADVQDKVLKGLPNFYLYVDEFQSFANESFADILSEARKYKLNLTIAHQYIEQMSEEVKAAVFGNVGTMIAFRVGAFDAEVFEKEFAPQFTMEDIVNLGFAQIYLKLMIDGIGSQPFSAKTLPPIKEPAVSFKKEIIDASRAQFSQPREKIENDIRAWMQPIAAAPKPAAPAVERAGREASPLPRKEPRESKKPEGLGDFIKEVVTKDEKKPENKPQEKVEPKREPIPERKEIKPVPVRSPEPAISLNELKAKIPKNTEKEATQKNLSELRQALAAAVGKETPKVEVKKQIQPPQHQPEKPKLQEAKKPEQPQVDEKAKPGQPPREVPEDVLRNLLNVDQK